MTANDWMITLAGVVIFVGFVAIASWILFGNDRPAPEPWSFEEAMRTPCSGGTRYDAHSLVKVRSGLLRRCYWRCWNCEGRWRTE